MQAPPSQDAGVCAYCGLAAPAGDLRREPVLPQCWQPGAPSAQVALTVPSCGPCSRRWARVEEQLPASGVTSKAAPARELDRRLWVDVSEKLIRALHFAETGGSLPRDLAVTAAAGSRHLRLPVAIPLDRSVAPGITYGRIQAGTVSAWKFLIRGEVLLFAVIKPGRATDEVPATAVATSRR